MVETQSTTDASCAEIDSVEHSLREELQSVQLVGEIDLDRWGPTAEAALRTRVRSAEPDRLRRMWPATFVTYMVHQGVSVYEHATFWPNVSIAELRLGGVVGPAFEKALRALDLPTFDDLEELEGISKGTKGRYIRRIHLHGGLPRSAVDNVIALLSSTLRSGAASAGEVLDMWAGVDLGFQLHSKAAERCLRYTGEFAERQIAWIIELIRVANRNGDLSAVRAPSHLEDGVRRFVERPDERAVWDFVPGPSIRIDPHRGDPFLHVPPDAERVWSVNGKVVGVGSRQVEERFALPYSPDGWTVTSYDGSEQQVRRFAPEPMSRTVLVFDERGRLHRRGAPLGGIRAYVVAEPSTVVEGEIDRRTLTDEWSGYELRSVDVRSSNELVVQLPTNEQLRIPVENQLEPRVSRGVLTGVTSSGRQVVSGTVTIAFDRYLPHPADTTVRATGSRSVRLEDLPQVDGEFDITRCFDTRGVSNVDVTIERDGIDPVTIALTYVPGLKVIAPRLSAPAALVPVVIGVKGEADGIRWQRIQFDPHENTQQVEVDVLGHPVDLSITVNRLLWTLEGPHTVIPLVDGEGFSVRLPELHAHRLLMRTGGVGVRVALIDGDVEHEEWARPERHRPEMRVFHLGAFADSARSGTKAHRRVVVDIDDDHPPIVIGVIESRYEPLSVSARSKRTGDDSVELEVNWRELTEWPNRVVRIWDRSADLPIATEPIDPGTTSARLELDGAPAGSYLAEVGVESGWDRPRMPTAGPAVVPVYIGLDDAERLRQVVSEGDRRELVDDHSLDQMVPVLADLVAEQHREGSSRSQRLALFERIADDHRRTVEVASELHDRLAGYDPGRSMFDLEAMLLPILPMLWVFPVSDTSDGSVRPVHLEHLWEIAPTLAASCDQVRAPDGSLDDQCDRRWQQWTGFGIAPTRNLARALDKLASAIPSRPSLSGDSKHLLDSHAWSAAIIELIDVRRKWESRQRLAAHRSTLAGIVERSRGHARTSWTGVPARVQRRLAQSELRCDWLPDLVRLACELLQPTSANIEVEEAVIAALSDAWTVCPAATRTAFIYSATALRLRESAGQSARLVQ